MSKLQLENSTLSSLDQLLTINYNKLLELELEETPNEVVQNDNSNEYQPAEENGRSLVATLSSQNFRE